MQQPDEGGVIALPGFVFDVAQLELRESSGARVLLRPQTLQVLDCLARCAGRVVTKDELMRAVWPEVVVTDDSLVQCITELRKALGDDARRVVQTAPKRGYRLVALPGTALEPPRPAMTAIDNGFRQDIRFATTADRVRIAYATSGNGPPLVRAAHWMTDLGWDWRSSVWGPRIQHWSQNFRLLRFDWRGCGMSDRQADPGDLDECVADLEAVVDAAGLDRFSLFASSGGTSSAVRYAARHPERVTSLVVFGGYARGHLCRGERSVPLETFNAMQRLIEVGWGQDHPGFRQLFTSLMWPGATLEQLESFNHMQRVARTPQVAARMRSRMAEFDATADLPRVQCPTLVLHSPRDSAVPFEEGRLIASMIAGARLVPFDSFNHSPLPGEPAFEQVIGLIDEFLLSHSEDPSAARRSAEPVPAGTGVETDTLLRLVSSAGPHSRSSL
jgi:pimeloyl-ACP methyl ester carboxylesterase